MIKVIDEETDIHNANFTVWLFAVEHLADWCAGHSFALYYPLCYRDMHFGS